jgi:hypothetical protein
MPLNRFPGFGYSYGRDFNFFEKLDVNWSTFGGNSVDGYQPDMIVSFTTSNAIFINEGSGIVEYSFNGTTVHGELDSSKITASLTFNNRKICKIWFRLKTGSSGPIKISVQAWM